MAITAQEAKEKLANSPIVLPWMEETVAASLPHYEAPERIREVLERFKGDVDAAVSQLLDEWDTACLTDTETLANEGDQLEADTACGPIQGGLQDVERPIGVEVETGQPQQQQQLRVAGQMPTGNAERKELEPQKQELRAELQQQQQQQQVEKLSAGWQRIDVQPLAEKLAPEGESRRSPPPPIPIKEIAFDGFANGYGPPPPLVTPLAEATEADVGDLSRIKRRKSPDGSPVGIINDDASSTASSPFPSSSPSPSPPPRLSRSPSASDISFTERRRRKPPPASTPVPARRSSRIKAKAAASPSPPSPPLPPSPLPAAGGPLKSRRQRRQAKKKKKAPVTGSGSGSGSGSGGRKRKDVGMQTVTVGIRELYV